ncbi:hypothetical protein HN51_047393 [Arachis hypogaea]|uniref:GRF-type domain-containing protein n=2 Tax=Arachis hypogaea TaxID=3818 RepID=A0A445AGR1_ARAHY|nr:uncharacterized protein LOC107627154 [Arachis ipaensis]XP_025635901.1 uncharacterized protein LOC112729993 [Arachis hypogaea]QHO23746.1 GRF zinc finger protein [Arachis hypogaea]RYR25568.1 hypothetical protein Ahy_B02g059380 isoform B [Arachis hypogaea]
MQGSSSISSSSVDALMPRCHCGVRSPIRTAWKCDYPGRRFYGCSGYETTRKCSFFQWYDPEPPARYSDVIRRFLETNEGIISENTELKKTRQELLDELRRLQQSVHETRAKLEATVAASMAMEDNMLASVATTRKRGVVIIVLISVIVLLVFFPIKVAS